jgi:hypothetical protein
MIVYSLNADPDFPGIKYVDINSWFDIYSSLESSTKRIARKWVPPKCRHYTMQDFHDASCRTKRQSQALFERGTADFVTGLPSFSERAKKLLAPSMTKYGEFLPLDIEGDKAKFFYFHCTQMLDSLDLRACEPYISEGEVSGLKRVVFDRSKMSDAYIFRLAVMPSSCRMYVTSDFVSAMPKDLTGFIFSEVWRDSSEGAQF